MRRLLPLILSASVMAQSARAEPWVGPDKALHFTVSAGIAGVSYPIAALLFDDRSERAGAAFVAAWSAGVLKEVIDGFGAGEPSFADLTWDLAGAVVGAVVAYAIDRWIVAPLAHSKAYSIR